LRKEGTPSRQLVNGREKRQAEAEANWQYYERQAVKWHQRMYLIATLFKGE
jgi:hypothetical protein